MAKVYRYTHPDGYYSGEVETYGFKAVNTTLIKPEVIKGFWPRWPLDDPAATAWEQVEDHRKRNAGGSVPPEAAQEATEATEFWLPGDTWQTPARVMVEIGPLPEGALLERPEPTEAEKCAMRIAEIKGELQAIDAAKVRPMSAIAEGTATEEDHTILAERNARADDLRAEMQMLEAFI